MSNEVEKPGSNFSREDIEIVKMRLMQEMRDDITTWAKKRFSIFALLIAAVSVFGLNKFLDSSINNVVTKKTDDHIETISREMKIRMEVEQRTAERVVDGHLRELTEKISKADDVSASLSNQASKSQEIAEENRLFIDEAKKSLIKNQDIIKSMNEKADSIKEEIDDIRSVYGEFGREVFERVVSSERSQEESNLLIENTLKRLENLETTLRDIMQQLDSPSANDDFGDVLNEFSEKLNNINFEIDQAMNTFEENSKYKVIIYIRRGADFLKEAEELVYEIRRAGFDSEVWITDSENEEEALQNIASSFHGIEERINSFRKGGLAYWPSAKIKSAVVSGIMSDFASYSGLADFSGEFEVDEAMRVKLDDSVAESSETMLVYKIE